MREPDTAVRPTQTEGSGDTVSARPRRLRRTAGLRALVREHTLSVSDLILPVFVIEERNVQREIPSMPGIYQWSLDHLPGHVDEAAARGITAILLFGIPRRKDRWGTGSHDPDGIVQRAIVEIKERCPHLIVVADTCLCEYTDHGHCGIPDETDSEILNDATLEVLGRVAVSQAEAGADVVAPSGMMDGMVRAIRRALDAANRTETAIMSYSAKYASALYGPFRDAAQGAPRFGDRTTHQMDPANARDALREHALDVEEGADFLMVKPALTYLDIIRRTRDRFPDLPLVAYNVSGEYAMVKAAVERGWLDERSAVTEMLTGIKRAGADLIITYHAFAVAGWLHQR